MIDLSFTQDPVWIAQRQAQWKPIGKDLKTDLDTKTVGDVEHYFMTGEFRENGRISDGACVTWFPLQTPEGWDYVFENFVNCADVFEEKFYGTLRSQEGCPINQKEELAQWDYFHPKSFQKKITSRVPVGRSGEKVEIEVNPYRLIVMMISGASTYLKYDIHGNWPKWCERIEYLLSVMPYLSYDNNKKYKKREWPYKAYQKLVYFFNLIIKDFRCNSSFSDSNRIRFINMLEEYLETSTSLPEKMREDWAAAKKRYNYTSKFE